MGFSLCMLQTLSPCQQAQSSLLNDKKHVIQLSPLPQLEARQHSEAKLPNWPEADQRCISEPSWEQKKYPAEPDRSPKMKACKLPRLFWFIFPRLTHRKKKKSPVSQFIISNMSVSISAIQESLFCTATKLQFKKRDYPMEQYITWWSEQWLWVTKIKLALVYLVYKAGGYVINTLRKISIQYCLN